MTTTTITGGTGDCRIASSSGSYSNMVAGGTYENDGYLYCGQNFYGNIYYGNCTLLLFDTSSIPDTDVISQVNLRLVATLDASTAADFDVVIKKFDWSGKTNAQKWSGVQAADSDNSIWRNTSGLSVNTQYTSGNLATDWVNKTGTTYYALQSSRLGVNTPTGNETIQFADAANATVAYRPVLIIEHSAGGQSLTLSCAAGSYALTGSACTLTVTRASQNLALACDAGTFVLTGADVTLTAQRNYSLSLDAGSYELTGADVTLIVQRNYTLSLDAGIYKLTGSDVSFTVQRNYTLACDAGIYELTGSDVTFTVQHNYALICEGGNYALTGTSAGIRFAYVIALGVGAYGLTGSDATFIFVTGFDYAEYWDGYVRLSRAIASSGILNVENNNSAVMNREINLSNYSELEEL